MSAYTDVASTAGAFRGGAHEFLSKPFDLDDAVALAQRVLAQRDGDDAEMHREPEPAAAPAGDALVGDTPAMQIGRAHVCTPVTNAHLASRPPPDNKTKTR